MSKRTTPNPENPEDFTGIRLTAPKTTAAGIPAVIIDLVQSLVETRVSPLPCSVSPEELGQFPLRLQEAQKEFASTGAIHAAAVFNQQGHLLALREDVGRHNALDKLIGHFLQQDEIPLHQYILLLSGRASFELLQKASMAGIQIVAAVGAPSSLAVQLADEAGITLVGFLRNERMNVYTHPHRIQ